MNENHLNSRNVFRILLVEDEPFMIEGTLESLRAISVQRFSANFNELEVDVASTQAEALEKVQASRTQRRHYHLILLDLQYPQSAGDVATEFLGLEFLNLIRKDKPFPVVVIHSAYSSGPYLEQVVKGIQLGAAEFVSKTTPWSEISERMARAWELARRLNQGAELSQKYHELFRTHLLPVCLQSISSKVDEHKNTVSKICLDLRRIQGADNAATQLEAGVRALSSEVDATVRKASSVHSMITEEHDVQDALRDGVVWFEVAFEQNGVTLEWEKSADDHPVRLRARMLEWRLVLHELLQNALESVLERRGEEPTFKGHVKIAVNARPEGGMILKVEDNGVGIDPRELQERIARNGGRSGWKNPKRFANHDGDGLKLLAKIAHENGASWNLKPVEGTGGGAIATVIVPNLKEDS